MLLVSITKYMYLNPLTATQTGRHGQDPCRRDGQSRSRGMCRPLRTTTSCSSCLIPPPGPDSRLPMKNVLQGTFDQFFKNFSRARPHRHLLRRVTRSRRGGKAYLVPMEGEIDGDGLGKKRSSRSISFYADLAKCKGSAEGRAVGRVPVQPGERPVRGRGRSR